MVAPSTTGSKCWGRSPAINRPDERDFTTDDLALLVALANQAATAIANAHLFQEVQEQAITDSLTGFYNRRGFFTRGARVLQRASLEDQPLALLMLDIDHFKQINDRCGHAVGDIVLAKVATRCRASTRTHDLLGRLGGDEFVLLLPQTPLTVAGQIAARVRRAVAASPIITSAGPVAATVSMGVAAPAAGRVGLEVLLARADGALYAAKEAGRNRVVVQGRGGLHFRIKRPDWPCHRAELPRL